jgi:hypothetical protein
VYKNYFGSLKKIGFMKKIFLFLLLVAGFGGGVSAKIAAAKDSIPANPADVSSMDGILAALYDVISGPAGKTRNWDRMRTLFLPEARLIPTGRRPDGTVSRRVLSVEDYITNIGPRLEKDGFYELEIGRTVEQYGGIVHVFSAYAAKRKPEDAAPFMRGINSIQLHNDGKRWWIVTVFWENESPNNQIPPRYLFKQ